MSSLSGFFQQANPATLNDCDREQIHFAGAILDVGAMLVLDRTGEMVLAGSENAADFLKIDAARIFEDNLEQLAPDIAAAIHEVLPIQHGLHAIIDADVEVDGVPYDCVLHRNGDQLFLECMKSERLTMSELRKRFRDVSMASAEVLRCETWDEALHRAADEVRRLTGFKRVMIYQFHPDWSGEVIGESRDKSMASFLGLRFPATDIPKQARELYTLTAARSVADVHDRNLRLISRSEAVGGIDLTFSLLRAVSPMHTQYLRNMGVEATFSMRMMDGDDLWGLIACHHDAPTTIPFDIWGMLQEIAVAVMGHRERETRLQTAMKMNDLRALETEFARKSRELSDLEKMISSIAPSLQTFMKADGFAFQYGRKLVTCGATPPGQFIRELVEWASAHSGANYQYQTPELSREWQEAAAHADTACGVLLQPVMVHRVCQLIWFRGPVTQDVKWAGKLATKDSGTILTPRASFDQWSEKNRFRSHPWLESEIAGAREILRELLDMVAAQIVLREENADLQQFASKAAHDIKGPLRGIRMALSFIREDGTDAVSIMENLELADASAEMLDGLTDGLLELMVLRNQQTSSETVDLNEVVGNAKKLLMSEISASHAVIDCAPLARVQGNASLYVRIFLNLISNAIKYRSDADPVIRISQVDHGSTIEVSVADNGRGIPPEHAEKIFQPMIRLVAAHEVAGVGLGLSICTRIMEAMDGAIWVDETYRDGARFVLRFNKATA